MLCWDVELCLQLCVFRGKEVLLKKSSCSGISENSGVDGAPLAMSPLNLAADMRCSYIGFGLLGLCLMAFSARYLYERLQKAA